MDPLLKVNTSVAEDPQMLQKLHDILLGFAKNEAQKQGQPDRVRSAEYRGVTGWTFNDNEVHVIIGNRLLAANKPDAIKAALDLRENPSGGNLTEVIAYQTAKEAAGTDAVATAGLNREPESCSGVTRTRSRRSDLRGELGVGGIEG